MRHQLARGCRAIHNYISLALPSQVNEITGWDVRGKNVKALETWHKKLTEGLLQVIINCTSIIQYSILVWNPETA